MVAMSHNGYLRTIQTYNDLAKHIDDIQRHLDMLQGDGSWMGVSLRMSCLSRPNCPFSHTESLASSHGSSHQLGQGSFLLNFNYDPYLISQFPERNG